MPIERAEPAIMLQAASMSLALRSCIFCFAISRICALVIVPTLSVPGVFDPFSIFAAFLMKKLLGGILVMKVKLRSEKAVITTGIGVPFSVPCVLALNCLQNSMMLRPRWPSAGPIGGDGLAAPAGTCSLIRPMTSFAIMLSLRASHTKRHAHASGHLFSATTI